MPRERLRIFLRYRQLIGPLDPDDPDGAQGNVVVQCQDDNTAVYVPGDTDQSWQEFTDVTDGLDKLDLSWDKVNSGTSGQTTETNSAGSNYDKGISVSLTFNDRAYQFIYDFLCGNPCGILNAVEVMITDELCKKRYRIFEIKADNLTYSPFGAPCEFEVKLREADPVWHCIHKTFIWDNWQNWFLDGSAKHHPCFLTAVEPRPRLLASARMGLSIFGHTVPVISAIFNESDDAFRRILNVDNFVDAPLIRDFISNICDKCGLTVDTIFHDVDGPYYNACLYYPCSGAMYENANSSATSPGLSFHLANRWDITLAELLDKLKGPMNAEWYVTPNNNLVFRSRKEFFETPPIFDFTLPANDGMWDKYSLQYTFNGDKKPAYGRYQYNIDASDLASQEAAPLYNDIVDYDGPTDNLMLEGNLSKTFEFAPTGAVRDGRAKEDYLIKTVEDGRTVAYALVIILAVIVAALIGGVLSAGAGAALGIFLAVWALSIATKANTLKILMGSPNYTGAVRLTTEQVAAPRLILWDGVSLNRAKMVATSPDAIAPNPWFNPAPVAYTDRNKFQYAPAGIFNYPFFFDSYFLGNLYDTYHDAIDNPLKSLNTHQTFEFNAYLCCEILDMLGVWEDSFAKIGYRLKLEQREGYDVYGRIEHFNVNYDDDLVPIKGQVIKLKTPGPPFFGDEFGGEFG